MLLTVFDRVYTIFLRLYPADYRCEYGLLMMQAARDLSGTPCEADGGRAGAGCAYCPMPCGLLWQRTAINRRKSP
jgi:hypothetical protein